MKRALIIGGGFAGCAAAHQFEKLKNWNVTLVEKNSHLGAGVRTFFWGGHPYTFGPRHFLTQKEFIYSYLNDYLPMRLCSEHEFITYIESDANFYNFPINMKDIPSMPDSEKIANELRILNGAQSAMNLEEYWLMSVGETLYNKFIKNYSKKMWKVSSNSELDTFRWSPKGVPIKNGPRAAWDSAISAYPLAKDGYNSYFDISTKECDVRLNCTIEKYDIVNKSVFFNGNWEKYDVIINTISPDTLFDYCFGELPYIGRDLHKIVLPVEFCFPKDVYFVYYPNSEIFTRIVEYKKFTNHVDTKSTLIGLEIPSDNGKHYPLPITKFQNQAKKYFEILPDGVFSIGRAGCYRYEVDIDDCIEQALELKDKIS